MPALLASKWNTTWEMLLQINPQQMVAKTFLFCLLFSFRKEKRRGGKTI